MCFAFVLFLISLFALTACFLFSFFPFFYFFAWSKCEANVALLTEKPQFLIRASGAIVLSRRRRAMQTFTHELCSFNSIRQIGFLCLLSAGQAATFHQHAAERHLLLGSTAVPARSSMRDWMGFSWLLNNVTQIEMVGPGELSLPHSHLQRWTVMKSRDEAVP